MNSLIKKKSIIQFDGISNSRCKGHKICIDIFFNELLMKFPNQEDYIIVYSFDSLQQLKMERKQEKNQYALINITISYPENRSKFESVIVNSRDASTIIEKYNYYQTKNQEADR